MPEQHYIGECDGKIVLPLERHQLRESSKAQVDLEAEEGEFCQKGSSLQTWKISQRTLLSAHPSNAKHHNLDREHSLGPNHELGHLPQLQEDGLEGSDEVEEALGEEGEEEQEAVGQEAVGQEAVGQEAEGEQEVEGEQEAEVEQGAVEA